MTEERGEAEKSDGADGGEEAALLCFPLSQHINYRHSVAMAADAEKKHSFHLLKMLLIKESRKRRGKKRCGRVMEEEVEKDG